MSDGAVSFYLNRFVRVRVAKMAYGTKSTAIYQPDNEEHQRRKSKMRVDIAGDKLIPDYFAVIVPKVAKSLFI